MADTTPLNEGTVPAAVPADRAAMRQAVVALEALLAGTDKTVPDRQKGRSALAALHAALATSAPPPVEAGEPGYPDQTVMETDAQRGNCLQATLAAILGCPLDTVPHFVSIYPQGTDWWDQLCGWLYDEGYLLRYPPVDGRNGELLPLCGLGGWSERGFPHIVVGDTATGQMVHDPHPSRAGLTKVDYTILLYRRVAATHPKEPTEAREASAEGVVKGIHEPSKEKL